MRRHAETIRWVSVGVIVLAVVLIARSFPLEEGLRSLRAWIDGLGAVGPVVFAALYALATVLLVPGLVLTIAAGAIFGLFWGTVTISVGSTVGAALAFLIARYVARRKVAALARRRPRLGALDEAVGEGGWRIVALLRLSPVVPFNLQNYLYGLTRIRFGPYVLTSWLAMLPGTFLYIYVGHLTGAVVGERRRTPWEWVALAVGLGATVAVTVYVTRLARQKLQARTDLAEEGPGEEPAAPRPLRGALVTAAVAALLAAVAAYVTAVPEAVDRLLPRGTP